MINLFYNLKHNSFFKFIKKLIPQFFKNIIKSKIPNYYYLPTKLKQLPLNNYPLKIELKSELSLNYQIKLKEKFDKNLTQNSQMTYPDLIEKIKTIYKEDHKLNFLDIGGEKLDFYLELKKNFKNLNYFLLNKKEINDEFRKIKLKLKLENFTILENIDECSYKFDFINLGSVIQYIQNYNNFILKLNKISNYILISGITLYDDALSKEKNTIVKQINIHPSNFMFFFERKSFINIFSNFKLIEERICISDNPNFKNFKHLENIQYSDLLFKKI